MSSRPWPGVSTALCRHALQVTATCFKDRTVTESTMSACTSVIKNLPIKRHSAQIFVNFPALGRRRTGHGLHGLPSEVAAIVQDKPSPADEKTANGMS